MTEKEKQAFAIGYLRGISALLWNLEEGRGVQLSADDAAFYDEQVDVLAHALLGGKEDA